SYGSGEERWRPSSVSARWSGIRPGEAPEIFGVEEFEADGERAGFAGFAPGQAGAHARAGVEAFDPEPIIRADEVIALEHGAEAADQRGALHFLPGMARGFAEQADGPRIGEARAAAKAAAQVHGGVTNVEEARAFQGILIERGAREGVGLVDAGGQEGTQAVGKFVGNGATAELVGTGVQALVGGGDEVFLAIALALERSGRRTSALGELAAGRLVPFPGIDGGGFSGGLAGETGNTQGIEIALAQAKGFSN